MILLTLGEPAVALERTLDARPSVFHLNLGKTRSNGYSSKQLLPINSAGVVW